MNRRIDDLGYKPPKVKLTFWDKIAWPFARFHRLKRHLFLAIRDSGDFDNLEKLTYVIDELETNPIQPEKTKQLEIFHEAMRLLFYRKLADNETKIAYKYLSKIESYNDELNVICVLRLSFLEASLNLNKSTDEILPVITDFLKDIRSEPLYDHPVTIKVIDFIYTTSGACPCLKLLVRARGKFRNLDLTRSIISLCKCPPVFENIKIAAKWGGLIQPEKFEFSKTMSRDAYIIRARVSEWHKKFDLMHSNAEKATWFVDNDPDANYWCVRSLLYATDEITDLTICSNSKRVNESWNRLWYAVQLHNKQDLDSAIPVVKIINNNYDSLDSPEADFLLVLITKTLSPNLDRDSNQIIKTAKLSEAVRNSMPNLGWAAVNIALKMLIIDNDPHAAYCELLAKECKGEALTHSLIRVAGFLCDKKISDKGLNGLNDTVAELISVRTYYTEHEVGKISPENELIKSLENVLNNPLCINIPLLEQTVNTLILTLKLSSGDTAHVEKLINIVNSKLNMPDWLRWIAIRYILYYQDRDYQATQQIIEHGFNLISCTAIVSWLGCYAPPSFFYKYRGAIKGSEHAKVLIPYMQLYGWDIKLNSFSIISGASKYNQTTKIKDLSHVELEQTFEILCDNDRDIAFDCYTTRQLIIDGNYTGATEFLIKLELKVQYSGKALSDWWEPVLCYWKSVIDAHKGYQDDAVYRFTGLLKGPKSEEAVGQLALLALSKNQIEEAESLLEAVDTRFPGILYAKALSAFRRGDLEKAKNILETYDSTFPERKHYHIACQRLLASIHELNGDLKRSAEILRQVKAISPKDKVVSLRLSRLISCDTYKEYASGTLEESTAKLGSDQALELYGEFPDSLPMRDYSAFIKIFADGPSIVGSSLVKEKYGSPEYQIILHLLMNHGSFESAVSFIARWLKNYKQNPIPDYLKKTTYRCISWYFLKNAWRMLNANNKICLNWEHLNFQITRVYIQVKVRTVILLRGI
jgi:tetratricopeptide (TPR) repeat protein